MAKKAKKREPRLGAMEARFVETVIYPMYRKYSHDIADTEEYQNATDEEFDAMYEMPRVFMKRLLGTPLLLPEECRCFCHFDAWSKRRMGDYLNHLADINLLPADEDDYGFGPGDFDEPCIIKVFTESEFKKRFFGED